MPDDQSQALAAILGKCTQALRHNGPITLDYQWPANASRTGHGALTINTGGTALNIPNGDVRISGDLYVGDTLVTPGGGSGGSSATLAFHNNTGSTISAYSVMKIAGIYVSGSTPYATLATPTTTLMPFYAVTSSSDVADGENGTCSVSGPCVVKYDHTSGTPAYNDEWGVNGAAANIKAYGAGFTIIGIADSTNHYALAVQRPLGMVKANLTANLTSSNPGSANAKLRDSITPNDTNMSMSIYPDGMVTSGYKLSTGSVVSAMFHNGRWVLVSCNVCEVPV